jgi:hypothetical protein
MEILVVAVTHPPYQSRTALPAHRTSNRIKEERYMFALVPTTIKRLMNITMQLNVYFTTC